MLVGSIAIGIFGWGLVQIGQEDLLASDGLPSPSFVLNALGAIIVLVAIFGIVRTISPDAWWKKSPEVKHARESILH